MLFLQYHYQTGHIRRLILSTMASIFGVVGLVIARTTS